MTHRYREKLEGLIPELLVLNNVKLKPNQNVIEVVLNFHPRKERIQVPNAA